MFPALAAAITDIVVRPDRGLAGTGDPGAQVRALLLLRRQLDARLLARLAAVDEQGLAAADGFASTASWLRAAGNLDGGHARAVVHAARLTETLPRLAAVLATGTIGVEHLSALAAGARRLPAEVLATSDSTFADVAPHAHPGDLRRLGAGIEACYDADAAAANTDHVHDIRHLSLSRTFGDAYHLNGILTAEGGAALTTALESLMRPAGQEDTRTTRQRRADALIELTEIALRSAQLPDSGGDRPRLTYLVRIPTTTPISWLPTTNTTSPGNTGSPGGPGGPGQGPPPVGPQPLGDPRTMLTDLAGTITGHGPGGRLTPTWPPDPHPDHPDHPDDTHDPDDARDPEEATTTTRDGLHGPRELDVSVFGPGDATLTGLGALLPTTTLERIGCDADLNYATVNQWGEILNYGRTRRHATPAQRRALILRDRHCVFPHCDAPPHRCHAHHLTWWSRHGRTDLGLTPSGGHRSCGLSGR